MQFQEHIESLSIDKCSPRSGPHGTSPIKQLAKAQVRFLALSFSDCESCYCRAFFVAFAGEEEFFCLCYGLFANLGISSGQCLIVKET